MTTNRNSIGNSSTIIRQNEQESDNSIRRTVPEEDYNNYYYPARARAREGSRFQTPTMEDVKSEKHELPPREVMDKIADAYRSNIADRISAAAAGIIERALANGMEPATVILAIEETGLASRPSPYYLSAVLRNWAENGVVVSRSREIGVKVTGARPWWR